MRAFRRHSGDAAELVEGALLRNVLTLKVVLGVGVRGAGALVELVRDVLVMVDKESEDAILPPLGLEDVVAAPASQNADSIASTLVLS